MRISDWSSDVCSSDLFADRILRPVLDRQTAARASIVGCCMIDMNGFLPTHISERSQPQGEDEEENHLYSRNRCIFMDSSTRAAMDSEGDYFLFTYRQDFGEGRYRALRSVFVPLMFTGSPWGLSELGYLICSGEIGEASCRKRVCQY